MTDCPNTLSLPIPCPRCDHVLSHNDCDCGFHLETRKPDPPRQLDLYEGHPLFI